MKGRYKRPSELLQEQRKTGKSYWDLIGRPLYDEGKDEQQEFKPATDNQIQALQYLMSLNIDSYDEGKDALVPETIPQNAPLSYSDYYGITGDLGIDAGYQVNTQPINKYAKGKDPYAEAMDLITGFEGFEAKRYNDSKGVPTIGYGTTDPRWVNKGVITEAQARQAMREYLVAEDARLAGIIHGWNELPDTAKNALRSYNYNFQIGRKSSPKFLQAMRNRDYNEAMLQLDAGWNDTENSGLRKRREIERELFIRDLKDVMQPRSNFANAVKRQYEFEPFETKGKPQGIEQPFIPVYKGIAKEIPYKSNIVDINSLVNHLQAVQELFDSAPMLVKPE